MVVSKFPASSAIAASTSPSFLLINVVNSVLTSLTLVPRLARSVSRLAIFANTPVGRLVSSPGLPIRLVRLVSVVSSSLARSATA